MGFWGFGVLGSLTLGGDPDFSIADFHSGAVLHHLLKDRAGAVFGRTANPSRQTEGPQLSGGLRALPFLSVPGMKSPMGLDHRALRNLRVNLGCRNALVPEHFLDGAQVGAAPE